MLTAYHIAHGMLHLVPQWCNSLHHLPADMTDMCRDTRLSGTLHLGSQYTRQSQASCGQGSMQLILKKATCKLIKSLFVLEI